MKRCPSCKTAFPTDYTHCPRDGSSLITIGEWAEGTLVRGKYRILAKVGQGGMGSVYKAIHARFKEVRAIKVINTELASDANFVRRFEQEAIITRKLQHPNAVRVEDIDEAEDGRPFIVMEYIEGHSLKDVIEQEAPMDVHRVCAIVKQAAAALDAAHTLGLVHRDIKPANIALLCSIDESGAPTEQVKVLDFGIAKLKEAQLEDSKASHLSHLTLTSTGVVIGTPVYMSPEQARGLKGDQLDGRSDLYSLGIVMYQMLTGVLPLKADSTIEQLMAHINIQPKPIQEVRPDVPDQIASVVMRCLAKNREERPASGQALIQEVDFRARSMPIQPALPVTTKRPLARPGGPPGTVRAAGPNRTVFTRSASHRLWVLGAMTAFLLGGFGVTRYFLKSEGNRGKAVQATRTVQPSTPVTPVSSDMPARAERPGSARPAQAEAAPPRETTARAEVAMQQRKAVASASQTLRPTSAHENPTTAVESIAGTALSSPAQPISPSNSTIEGSSVPAATLHIATMPSVPEAQIEVDGQIVGATDTQGRFALTLKSGEHRLRLSRSGYSNYESTVNITGDQTNTIALAPDVAKVPVGSQDKPTESDGSERDTRSTQELKEAVAETYKDVFYFTGFISVTPGTLQVSARGVSFNADNDKVNFTIPCSEIRTVKWTLAGWGTKLPGFHMKARKNYSFALINPLNRGPNDAERQTITSIIGAVTSTCKVP